MDRFDAMRVFTRIVERRSFTQAADDLGLPRSSVTDAVKTLEARLGVRLLQRTTRQVSPTLDGEAYYQRCVNLIADLEEAEGAFTGAKPSGLIRVDVHGTQARHFLLPGLPDFLGDYPGIRLHFAEVHQPLDMIREGFDCILRTGDLADSPLIQRRLALLERGTFASPAYLARFGAPRTPDQLDGHRMVGLMAQQTSGITPLDFRDQDGVRQILLPATITVTGPETNVASACTGLGLIQVPRYRVEAELAAGVLVEVLPDFPPTPLPVYILYSHTRQLSPRLRVFIDWVAERYRGSAADAGGGDLRTRRLAPGFAAVRLRRKAGGFHDCGGYRRRLLPGG
jgi:DNA-binding transcriptional LysR family regulator